MYSHTANASLPNISSTATIVDTAPPGHLHQHFEIRKLETAADAAYKLVEKQLLQHFELVWCLEGEGMVYADGKTGHLNAQQLYVLVPGQQRHYQLQLVEKGYYIRFSPDFLYLANSGADMESIWRKAQFSRCLVNMQVKGEMLRLLEMVIASIRKELQHDLQLRTEITSGLVNLMLIYITRQLHEAVAEVVVTREAALVQQFLAMAREHFLTRKKVADYAAELNVTPNYLNTAVKNITGLTASYQIQLLIINEAKRQLIYANRSMKEISYYLGFDNVAHFSKYFKSKTGVNFTCFKKELA
ncbi:AraC-type DNA-binding protein [Filimonas lacunae]|uniref:AraC-type DNA-binding protein n=1 Tax=Filimonas lacunae TaxID=477680 RepID=A0A173MCB5_9BACT|nr:helix-turn-helix domain-containing protein [Filimonas lacunae]BAV05101.1 transcriptional regulator, AraC family [Filimonas lacunae]SIT34230.1 AraC-type DNA-binding protein [Filimonas lacunae]